MDVADLVAVVTVLRREFQYAESTPAVVVDTDDIVDTCMAAEVGLNVIVWVQYQGMQVDFRPPLAAPYCPSMTCIYAAKTEHEQHDNLCSAVGQFTIYMYTVSGKKVPLYFLP